MQTTEQLSEVKAAASNRYLQQEIDLSQNIIAAIEASPEIFSVVEVWEKLIGDHQRISSELEKFRERKNGLEATIADLKQDFGSEDSFADLKKIEECESKLKAVSEAIPLLEQKLDGRSNFLEEIRKNKSAAEHAIRLAVLKINIQLQENIDAKVNDILQTFSMYQTAIERVRTEQKLVPSKLLMGNTLRGILPEVKGLDKLTRPNIGILAGYAGKGLAA